MSRREHSVIARVQHTFKRRVKPVLHRVRYGVTDLPVVFGNSFPKSGTNLLMQILRSLEALDTFLDRGTFIS